MDERDTAGSPDPHEMRKQLIWPKRKYAMSSASPSERGVPPVTRKKRLAEFLKLVPLAASLMQFTPARDANAADYAPKFTDGTEIAVNAENYLAGNRRMSNGDVTARKALAHFDNDSGESGIGVGVGAVTRDIYNKEAATQVSEGGYDDGKLSLYAGFFSGELNAAFSVEESAVVGNSHESVAGGTNPGSRSYNIGFARTSARMRAGDSLTLEGSYDRYDSRLDLHLNDLDLDPCLIDLDGGYASLAFQGGRVSQKLRRLDGGGVVKYRQIASTGVSFGIGGYYSGIKSESEAGAPYGSAYGGVNRDLAGPMLGFSGQKAKLRGAYLFGKETASDTSSKSIPRMRAAYIEILIADAFRAGAVISRRIEEADLSLALKF